jgi:hypothetical protein
MEEILDELKLLQSDNISAHTQIINLKNQVTMLQNMVNGLQAERAEREKTIVSEVKNCLENNALIKSYIQDQLDSIRAEALLSAREELNNISESI